MKIYIKAIMASSVAMMLGLSSPASAELSAQELVANIDRGDLPAKIYLTGLSTGIEWSNTAVHGTLFCQPGKLAITSEQNLRMLRDLLEEVPGLASSPAGLVVLASYKRTFPCSAKTD